MLQTDRRTDRQADRQADRQDAAPVTSHLHHPLVQRAAGRRLCAPSSCRRLHQFTRRTHVGAYPPCTSSSSSSSSTGQTEEPASGGTARQRRAEQTRCCSGSDGTDRTEVSPVRICCVVVVVVLLHGGLKGFCGGVS